MFSRFLRFLTALVRHTRGPTQGLQGHRLCAIDRPKGRHLRGTVSVKIHKLLHSVLLMLYLKAIRITMRVAVRQLLCSNWNTNAFSYLARIPNQSWP